MSFTFCENNSFSVGPGCGGGGGGGPLPASDAYQNWLVQQAAAQTTAAPGGGQVTGATTEQPSSPSTPTPAPQGEVKGASTFLPPTGFDLNEFLALGVLFVILAGAFVFARRQMHLSER